MLLNYIDIGVSYFVALTPIVFIIMAVFYGIKFLVKRKFNFKPLSMLCEFAWVLTVLIILSITGVIGGDYGNTSIFQGNIHFSFSLFQEGLSTATLLNLILFIPFGFFSPIIFKKLREKWIYGILIGLVFSIIIEFFQTFSGRFIQLDDILMNTLGTFIGYEIYIFLRNKMRKKKS